MNDVDHPAMVRRKLLNRVENVYLDYLPPSDRMRQMLAGSLMRCFTEREANLEDAKQYRYAITEYLTGFTSVYDVPEGLIRSMMYWLDIGVGIKIPSEKAIEEAWLVLRETRKNQGQGELL